MEGVGDNNIGGFNYITLIAMVSTPRGKKCGQSTCDSRFDDVENSINCGVCKIWFHITCVKLDKDEADLVKKCKSKSILWKCENCVIEQPSLGTVLKKISAIEKLLSTKFDEFDNKILKIQENALQQRDDQELEKSVLLNTNIGLDEHTETEELTNNITDTNPASIKKRVQFESEIKVCEYYKKSKCRHGSSGKQLIDGKECKFLHPRKCIKYCRYGKDPVRGCSRTTCSLFHPVLCKNSIEFMMCNNPTCTFTHLAGTKRNNDIYFQSQTNRNNLNMGRNNLLGFQNDPSCQNYYRNSFNRPLQRRSYAEIARENLTIQNEVPRNQSIENANISNLTSAIKQMNGKIDLFLNNTNYQNTIKPQAVSYPRTEQQPLSFPRTEQQPLSFPRTEQQPLSFPRTEQQPSSFPYNPQFFNVNQNSDPIGLNSTNNYHSQNFQQ